MIFRLLNVLIFTILSVLRLSVGIKLPSFSFKSKRRVDTVVDLRSDTITKPTPEMRTAMFEAEVGDDVFGEDPTVNTLEDRALKLFQKESALFLPTGTMANLVAIMSWCSSRGSEMILGDKSHIFLYEQGGASSIAGVTPRIIKNNDDGTFDIDTLEASIRPKNIHFPTTELICIENTHNACGGRVLPQDFLESLGSVSKRHSIPIHLDGARIWNAATASGNKVHEIAGHVDSVSVCLSKGLGAPAGSILLGPKEFIDKARRARKVLGGGMRQSGILAAAGLVALNDFSLGILKDDHKRALTLAMAINEMPFFSVDIAAVETNILMVKLTGTDPGTGESTAASVTSDSTYVASMLKEQGLLVLPFGQKLIRLVIHRNICNEDITRAIQILQDFSNTFSEVKTEEVPTVLLPAVPAPPALKAELNAVEPEAKTRINDNANSVDSNSSSVDDKSPVEISSEVINTCVSPLNERITADQITDQVPIEAQVIPAVPSPSPLPSITDRDEFEEVKIFGMSVSDRGFRVILKAVVTDRYLAILVTPNDPMSDGMDRDRPETAEAVTLLQLLQGIDVESHLPRDALFIKFNEPIGSKYQISLNKVIIDNLTDNNFFSARLCCCSKKAKETESTSTTAALVNVPIQHHEMSIPLDSISEVASNNNTASTEFDNLAASPSSSADLINTISPVASDVPTLECSPTSTSSSPASVLDITTDDTASTTGSTTSTSTSNIITNKSIEVKNAFEVLALAIRHNSIIEVRSNLLQDDHTSYDANELRTYFPSMVEVGKKPHSEVSEYASSPPLIPN